MTVFFFEFRKNHTCPKDDWNIFLGRPYQNLLISDERTAAKVQPWGLCEYVWVNILYHASVNFKLLSPS